MRPNCVERWAFEGLGKIIFSNIDIFSLHEREKYGLDRAGHPKKRLVDPKSVIKDQIRTKTNSIEL
jgi:hypothetical protein